MSKVCIISTWLPPVEKILSSGDEAHANFISVLNKLNLKIYYIFIDENKHHYKDGSPEKEIRINNLKSCSNFYQIKKSDNKSIKKKVEEIILNNNLLNFFIVQNCIDFIEKNKNRKVIMWGLEDNIQGRERVLYFKKNIIKKLIFKVFFIYKNLSDRSKIIKKLNKSDIVLQPGRIYFDKWRKSVNKQTKIFLVHPGTEDYQKRVKIEGGLKLDKNKKNILLIGQPNSSLASGNIKYLCEEIMPILKKENLIDHFHFYIIGKIHEKLNDNLKYYIDKWKKYIFVTDYIDDLSSTMSNSDAVIQLTPFYPVAATRIYGWTSLSPLLIANNKITKEYPQLVNNENCFLGSSPHEFIIYFKKILYEDEKIPEIRRNFRKLYDLGWSQESFQNLLLNVFKDFYLNNKIKNDYSQY